MELTEMKLIEEINADIEILKYEGFNSLAIFAVVGRCCQFSGLFIR